MNKTISLKKENLENEFYRFDPKYYFVKNDIKKIKNSKKFKSHNIADLGIEISSGSYIDEYVTYSDGIPYIRVGNIKSFSINDSIRNTKYVSSEVPEKVKVKKNEIVIPRTQNKEQMLGVASLVDLEDFSIATSQHVSKLSFENSGVSPFFLVAYLNSKFYLHQLALASHGDTRVELTHSQFKSIEVIFPTDSDINEIIKKVKKIILLNRKIVNLYKDIDDYVNKLLKLDELKISKPNEVKMDVRGIKKLDIWNAKNHQNRKIKLEEYISLSFNNVELSEITNSQRGKEPGSKNYLFDIEREESDLAFMRTSDVVNHELDISPDYFLDSLKFENNATSNSIVFSRDGVIGETAFITDLDNPFIASGFIIFELNEKASDFGITPEYLFAILKNRNISFNYANRRTVIASTIPHLRENLGKLLVPIFEKNEINEITKYVKEVLEFQKSRKKLILQVRSIFEDFFNQVFDN